MTASRGTKLLIDGRALSSQRGGVARITSNLLLALGQRKDVAVVCLVMKGTDYNDLPTLENIRYVELSWPFGMRRYMRVVVEHTSLYLQLIKFNPDVAVFMGYTMPVLPLRKLVKRLVLGLWDVTFHTHPGHYTWKERLVLRRPSKFGAQRSDLILTCSAFDERMIRLVLSGMENPIYSIELNADRKFFEKGIARLNKDLFRVKYDLPSPHYVLVLGVIYNRRRVDAIVDAYANLKEQKLLNDVSLLVVGKDLTRPSLNIKNICADRYGLGVRYCEFLPEEDLISAYKHARAYICLSEIDGEAILLKEAAAVGTPVITTRQLSDALGRNTIELKGGISEHTVAQALVTLDGSYDQALNIATSAKKYLEGINQERNFNTMLKVILGESDAKN